LEKKIERERILITRLPELSVNILELAKAQGTRTIGLVVSLTGTNRNRAKSHLKALVAANQLAGCGKSLAAGRLS
jgi:ABC-type branched-subunit amino acid transport system substrate-binding protein